MTLSAPAAAIAAVLSFAVLATWLHGYVGISCRIGQTGTLCLHTLICFRNAVHLSVLTEIVSGSEKPKRNVCVPALVVQGSDPLIAAGTVAVVVFPVAEYLFHLSGGKVLFGMHFRKNRCDHERLVLCRNCQQQGQPFLCTFLIFRCHTQCYVFPAVAPVFRQVVCHTFCPLRLNPEVHISAAAYHVPHFFPPVVCLLQKKVTGHTDVQHCP